MKAVWLMIAGASIFLVSFLFHYLVSTYTGKDEAYIISLGMFISPLLVLAGIVIYIMTERKRRPPQ
jgi:ABC-type thiamin/hydroxymethylpyrimidine transport system permease subunit